MSIDSEIVREIKQMYRRLSAQNGLNLAATGQGDQSQAEFEDWLAGAVNVIADEVVPKYNLSPNEFQRLARLAIFGKE